MRTSNKTFITYVSTEVTKTASNEDIINIIEDKKSKIVNVVVEYMDSNNNILGSDPYSITGDKYDLLMSQNPSFAPGKPLNEYREADLWYIIDLIRSGQ